MTDNEKAFLIGLEKLTRETGIRICGCGCCGSPYMAEAEISSEKSGYGFGYAGEVSWLDPKDDYYWEKYSESIVKK